MLKKLPDFNRLRVFYYVYQYQSVTASSEALNISPSAVSQQLSKLEDEIGVKLFSRPHKRLVATSAGSTLFETVKPFIQSLDATISQLQSAKDVPAGLVKVGAPLEFGKVFMPKLIAGFRRMYPDVIFHVKIGRTSELLPLVQNGDLDLAFIDTFPTKKRLQVEWNGISMGPVFEETVVLACSENYYRTQLSRDVSFNNLRMQDFIAQQLDASAIRNWFFHNYGKKNIELNVVLTVANHQAVANGILADLGLGIIVAQLVGDRITSGDIHVIETGKKNPVNQVSLAQLMDKVPTLAEKSFQLYVLQKLRAEMV